jgi:hypothetical protein
MSVQIYENVPGWMPGNKYGIVKYVGGMSKVTTQTGTLVTLAILIALTIFIIKYL